MKNPNGACFALVIVGVLGTMQLAIVSPKPVQIEVRTPIGSVILR